MGSAKTRALCLAFPSPGIFQVAPLSSPSDTTRQIRSGAQDPPDPPTSYLAHSPPANLPTLPRRRLGLGRQAAAATSARSPLLPQQAKQGRVEGGGASRRLRPLLLQQGVCAALAPPLHREQGLASQVRPGNLAGWREFTAGGWAFPHPTPEPPCRVGKAQVKKKMEPHIFSRLQTL